MQTIDVFRQTVYTAYGNTQFIGEYGAEQVGERQGQSNRLFGEKEILFWLEYR